MERGITYESLDAATKAKTALLILTDTLRFVVQTRIEGGLAGEGAEPQHAIADTAVEVARVMCAPQWNPWQVEWDNDPQTLTKALFGRADGEIPPHVREQ